MRLNSRIAKTYEIIIKSGNYNKEKMLSDINAAYKRKLMTTEEKEYLNNMIQNDIKY